MTDLTDLTATWIRPVDAATTALVVALHGRGADETSMAFVGPLAPPGHAVVSLRAPIAEGGGYAWFANRGIGRPLPESIADTIRQVTRWLDQQPALPTWLLGFSGGAAMAGGLLLAEPARYAGAVILSGTLPFDAGLPVEDDRLAGVPVLFARGSADGVIPLDLIERTRDYLSGASGADLTLREYAGLDHRVDRQMAQDIATWLSARAGSGGGLGHLGHLGGLGG